MTDDAYAGQVGRTGGPELGQILSFHGEPAPPRSYPARGSRCRAAGRACGRPGLEPWSRRCASSLRDDPPPPATLGRLLRSATGSARHRQARPDAIGRRGFRRWSCTWSR
ncbi:MAG: hypothetical protein U0797_29995 [Gemmataceae bacterium]